MATTTELIPGEEPHQDDAKVVKALGRLSKKHGPTDPAKPFVIGVRNEAGAIYRRATVGQLAKLLDIADDLEDLGFTDELQNAGKRKGFDGIFSRRDFGEES